MSSSPSCYFCGPAKNCARFLPLVFANLDKIGKDVFDNNYAVVVYYDNSTDATLRTLRKLQTKYGPERVQIVVNNKAPLQFRTHRIARARNACLKRIALLPEEERPPHFVMMDFDDVNCKRHVDTHMLKQHLVERDDWDALSFNTAPSYYDIWALSIYPFCFSYNHFKNTPRHNYSIIQAYVARLLRKADKENELVQCLSAFNGFAIYKTKVFIDAKYDGRVRTDLVPRFFMNAHQRAAKSPLIGHDYGNVDGRYEDCEHRAFHMQAIRQHNARIRISPKTLFT